MTDTPRIFTPEEASRTLPLVRRIVNDILAAGRRVKQVASTKPDDHPDVIREIEKLESLIKELESLGCHYKDWDFAMGLVDFPATIDGKDVLLCWRSDEPDVCHYHGWDEGFAGRRPLPRR